MNFLLILYLDPREGEAAWNALRIANQARESGLTARVFLLDRGVWTAHPSMLDSASGGGSGGASMEADAHLIVKKLLADGVAVRACGTCIERAGIDPREILPGVEIGTLFGLIEWIEAADRIVTI